MSTPIPTWMSMCTDITPLYSLSARLDLGGNAIEDEGAASLAEAVARNKALTELDLAGNLITAEGVSALAAALRVNERIQSLSLRHNHIGDRGAIDLAKACGSVALPQLRVLDLSHNRIGDAGMAALAKLQEEKRGKLHIVLFSNCGDPPAPYINTDEVNEFYQRVNEFYQQVRGGAE